MAAGDLVVADFQVELRGTLTGVGTAYLLGPVGISGLGNPAVKAKDTPLGHADGSYTGRDYYEDRVITVDYSLKSTPTTHAGALLVALKEVWAKSEGTDLALYLRLPGMGKMLVNGRPRGLVEDTGLLKHGFVRALATFHCGNPVIVVPPGAPTIGTATAGVGQATANWTAPASNGGSAITGYVVTTYRASDNVVLFTDSVGVVLTFTRTGLTAAVGVYFKVAAVNLNGTGPQSAASNTVTPT